MPFVYLSIWLFGPMLMLARCALWWKAKGRCRIVVSTQAIPLPAWKVRVHSATMIAVLSFSFEVALLLYVTSTQESELEND